ncbi:MAG: (2Fe-2S)-binding protein [Candidatus Sericytochromatia bacterium]|nr:(2Fe-2S)-binding protein [Candidatus Tanganyikabacteria bacterium]
MALVTIDGRTIEVPDGENVVQAAARLGIEIPHYCYHPGLPIDGNCRMCLCEVEGARGPQIACNTLLYARKDKEGNEVPAAVVRTDTPAVRDMRKGVMEFLLLNHPIDCPICDQAGECGLQDYYMRYGKYDHRSEVPKVEKAKATPIGPLVILDQERCILCSRCVRFTRHVTKTDELTIAGRGDKCRIETFPGVELANDYSGNVVDICPVGALTSRDFRFKKRVWFLSSAPSVCAGCSRGCNVLIDHHDKVVYRYRPRYNPAVNDWWLCDRGRLGYKAINENRLAAPKVAGVATTFALALEQLVAALRSSGVGIVIGPDASLEDMAVAKRLAAHLGAPLWGLSWKEPGKEDDFLMKADLAPNRKGFDLLGIATDEASFRKSLPGLKTLLAIAVDLPDDVMNGGHVVAFASHDSPQAEKAAIAMPIATHAERFGTYANFAGRVQRVVPALDPPGDALPAAQLLALIGRQLGATGMPIDLDAVWAGDLGPQLGLPITSFYAFPAEGLQAETGPAPALPGAAR